MSILFLLFFDKKPKVITANCPHAIFIQNLDPICQSGSVSASESKDLWFDPGSVQDFSHISDLLGLSGWLDVIGTECGLWIGTSS